jgi:hypothetical protein
LEIEEEEHYDDGELQLGYRLELELGLGLKLGLRFRVGDRRRGTL